MRTSASPDAAKAYASWRAPCTGTGPTAASWPSRVAAICRFMPGYPVLAENRSGTWRQSQVGHTVPSTSTVPRPTTSRGSGTPSARASPISGRSRSQRRLTVAWLTPNTAPAKSWVTFLRSRHTTRATDRNSPSASGGPVETNLSRPRWQSGRYRPRMADSTKKTLDDYWVPWSTISPVDITRFRDTLEAATGEADMQAFLEEHSSFLCQHLPAADGYWVIPSKRLGSEHITDFLIGENTPHQPTWYAVELERPQALLFTRRGDPSAALTHAMRQIDDWRNWLSRNRDYASRAPEWSGLGLGDIDPELDGLVIIGPGSMLDARVEDRRRRLARSNRTRIETYDWLVTQAAARAKPPQAPASISDYKDQFEEMRAER